MNGRRLDSCRFKAWTLKVKMEKLFSPCCSLLNNLSAEINCKGSIDVVVSICNNVVSFFTLYMP